MYDQTGNLDDAEELIGENFDDLYKYYRDLYKEVTEADIDAFAHSFRGSNEEAAEVLQYYKRFQGDMRQVWDADLDCVHLVHSRPLTASILDEKSTVHHCAGIRVGDVLRGGKGMHTASGTLSWQL